MSEPLPAKQNGISHDVYADFAATGECDRLLRGICKKRCVDANGNPWPLEQDHIIPKAHGGTDCLSNLRLLCRHENQKKSDRPESYYEETSGFFDQPMFEENLRDGQRAKGCNLVSTTYRKLFEDMPDNLFRVFMVIAWMVGSGKTVGTIGILMKINQVRREKFPNGWRIRRVLWLVHQRNLVDSIAEELKTELTQHGVLNIEPTVKTISKPEDWIINGSADIVVACTQVIWNTEGRALSAHTLRRYLGGFDAIVVDECQFAVDRYLELQGLAPKALKFAVTATPFDAERRFFTHMEGGCYRDYFRLFSSYGYSEDPDSSGHRIFKDIKPVFKLDRERILDDGSYIELDDVIAKMVERAQQSDNPLEHLPSLNTEFYEALDGESPIKAVGTEILEDDDPRGAGDSFNPPRAHAVPNRCIEIAKRKSNVYGYDIHMMVRGKSIRQIQKLAADYSSEEHLAEHGKSFGATAVYSGSRGVSLGSREHPWMLAKHTQGRAVRGSKRILFVVDIGQFGINQPACAVIGWIDVSYSIIDIVQRLGRAIRARPGIGGSIHVVWDAEQDRDGRFRIALYKAIDYIRKMESLLDEAFIPLDKLESVGEFVNDPVVAPSVPKMRKAEIAEVIGEALIDNPEISPSELYDVVIERVYQGRELGDELNTEVKDLVSTLAEPAPENRLHDSFFDIPDCLEPISYVLTEKASRRIITREDIALEIARSTTLREELKREELLAYDRGEASVVEHWQQIAKLKRDREFQVPKSRIQPSQILGVAQRPRNLPKDAELPDEKKNIDNSYAKQLRALFKGAIDQSAARQAARPGEKRSKQEIARRISQELGKHIPRALYTAAARCLSLENFQRVTIAPVEDHISHMLCAPSVASAIMGQAQGLILSYMRDEFPGLNRVFSNQVQMIDDQEEEANAA